MGDRGYVTPAGASRALRAKTGPTPIEALRGVSKEHAENIRRRQEKFPRSRSGRWITATVSLLHDPSRAFALPRPSKSRLVQGPIDERRRVRRLAARAVDCDDDVALCEVSAQSLAASLPASFAAPPSHAPSDWMGAGAYPAGAQSRTSELSQPHATPASQIAGGA